MELIGFDRQDNLSRGILDKLIAQIVVWDDQTRKTCIVSIGATREWLEKKYDCKIMLTQGASGNVRPKYQHSDAVLMEAHPHEAMIMKKTPDIVKKRFDESKFL